MLDLAFVRDHLELIEERLRQRGMDPAEVLSGFRELDQERRRTITQLEQLKQKRNSLSQQIGALKQAEKKGTLSPEQRADLDRLTSEVAAQKADIPRLEQEAADIDNKFRPVLQTIPNLPHESVPVGNTAEQNLEVRRWGKPPSFDFTPKPHWELGEQLGILDFERAAKLSGARFAVLAGAGQMDSSPSPGSDGVLG